MIVGCWTASDSLLATLAPLGLAAAAGTALVIDGEENGPHYPSEGSLADMVEAGPRRMDLVPPASGLAVLRNGGIELDQAWDVIEAFGEGWPHVVVRLPSGGGRPARLARRWPVVPVVPLLPHAFREDVAQPFVAQSTGLATAGEVSPEVVLPIPSRRTVTNLLAGRMAGSSRWIRRWRLAWKVAW